MLLSPFIIHWLTFTLMRSGSMAAATQATIGNVVAGSAFAWLQGMAMGAGVPVVLQAVGGAVTAGGVAVAAVVLG